MSRPPLFALAAVLFSAPALACSCLLRESELLPALKDAFAGAEHVLIARALGDSGEHPSVPFEVLEVFKGPQQVGKRVALETGGVGRNSCLRGFRRDEEWLIYSYGKQVEIRLCTRSRRLRGPDPELDWLRTKKPPPVPVALQRGTATCGRCDLMIAAQWLSRTSDEVSLGSGLREAAPFHSTSEYLGTAAYSVVGRAANGRFFELVERSDTDEACGVRVVRRWCDALSLDTRGSNGGCEQAGPEEMVCDETVNRQVVWSAPESIAVASCVWREPSHPSCLLASPKPPRKDGAIKGRTLKCLPMRDRDKRHVCHVE